MLLIPWMLSLTIAAQTTPATRPASPAGSAAEIPAGAEWVPAPSPNEVAVPSKIEAVTVYRGQALVTRLVDVPGPAGLREIAIGNLPANVVGGSLFAESADGVEVRSVLYRVRPLEHDVRGEVRKLDQQIRDVQDDLTAHTKHLDLLTLRRAYLDKLEQFVAPTATVELSKGVLNAETLQKITMMSADQRRAALDEELKLTKGQRDLNEQLSLLQRQRQELASASSKTAREAVVFINLQHNGGKLRLRYLVENANWSPSYNVRTNAGRKQVLVEVNAAIQQMSGEDWTNVAMTLSTASPSLVAKAPALAPMTIALVSPSAVAQNAQPAGDYKQARKELLDQRFITNNMRQAAQPQGKGQQAQRMQQQPESSNGFVNGSNTLDIQNSDFAVVLRSNDAELNRLAGELQNLDLNAGVRFVRDASSRPAVKTEDVVVTYTLAGRISLPSRTDRQLIQVAGFEMKGDFYKLATPVLSSHVYEEAAVANTSAMVLLAGPVTTYVAGQFVGHGQIPTVSIGESFTVGFGIDSSLRAGRELIEKNETTQGGNRLVDFTYRIAVENFGTAPAKVRVYDRMPQSPRSDVKVTLTSAGPELSSDAAYRNTDHKKGILRWEIEVPAQSIGPKAKSFDYQYRLEYDKQMTVAGLASR